jgi:hypothetical protein
MFGLIKFPLPDIVCIWIYLILCFLCGCNMKKSYIVSYNINNITVIFKYHHKIRAST